MLRISWTDLETHITVERLHIPISVAIPTGIVASEASFRMVAL